MSPEALKLTSKALSLIGGTAEFGKNRTLS